ncbi:MAG: hypothetical protein AB198_00020 [Parcubacteria bacterium C7867-003]|nr:MAG: hypothetical protein AB198_00020 [Parcubacteria bacterium C7867-003]
MKLITLNAWGGKLYSPLIKFIKENKDIDIFCFQDLLFGKEPVFSPIEKGRINIFEEIKNILVDHEIVISKEPEHSWIDGEILPPHIGSGKAIFTKKNLKLLERGEFDVSNVNLTETMVSSKCQWIELEANNQKITILNLHGLWQKGSKKQDTEERTEQSRRIHAFMKNLEGPKILAGDFNMVPDGKSMTILDQGMINLIKEYKIETTRNRHYPRGEKFADYILVSKDIKVNDFKVLPDEVSDHCALYLDFEINL